MSLDALTFRMQLDKLKDNVWEADKGFQEYQEYRNTLAISWNDTCSKYINQKYLEPIRRDSQELIQSLKAQTQSLTLTTGMVMQISQLSSEAETLSRQQNRLLNQIDQDKSLAAFNYSQSKERLIQAQEATQKVTALMVQVNRL